jgi:hypothetical protein
LTVLIDDNGADAMMIEEVLLAVTVPPLIYRVVDGSDALDFLHWRGAHKEAACQT